MRFSVTHTTTYAYVATASLSQMKVHLRPRECERQTVIAHVLDVDPAPERIGVRQDYFGNSVSFVTIQEPHQVLHVRARSEVVVHAPAAPAPTPAWEEVRDHVRNDRRAACLEAYQFVFSSPRVQRSEALAAYARASFPTGRPLLEAARELTHRIHEDFVYERGATDVATPVAEAFARRHGVCQDFAHVMVGCLRSLGLPARYVSGYLHTRRGAPRPPWVGADESHAWVSVYALGAGWVDFDPTNDVMVGEEHVTVGWGRDYGDVAPVRGVTIGGGEHTMDVTVDCEPVAVAPAVVTS